MTKYVYVTFTDGTWRIPANIVAEDRARYYADHDEPNKGEAWEEVYQSEIKHALEYEFDLLDHASNNMNWGDVEEYAEFVAQYRVVDHSEEWSNADKEVRDVSEED